ncbi:aldehyde dehydrogenase family protein [Devosia sp.]|uniref:aldehyde dehydrogenase family protein n=1 Tax=Devosia sp. TaxID=1871048 RepID=UPI0025BA75AC|nr:aldehyde dehydrogenase family protein [Devosia sp.]
MSSQRTAFVEPRREDARFTQKRRYQMLIDGKSVEAESGETITRESPAYADLVVSEIPRATKGDAERAILAARHAFDEGPWPRMSGSERSRILARVGEAIYEHREELAVIECLEVGKTIRQARGEMGASAEFWRYAAGHAQGLTGETHNSLGDNAIGLMLREPVGVVGIITPWNFPLLIGSERVPWALGAGCTVVVKPSEFTSGSTIRMAELARDCGLPDGVFNVITGYGDPVGQLLAEHPATDFLSFTGSFRVGQIVGGLAASNIKRVGLELGGKGPQIIFADSDLEAASDAVARSIFGVGGQACIAGSRLIVEAPAREEMLERLTKIADKVVIGDPLDENVHVGSLIHRPHLEKVESYVNAGRKAGARLVTGGERLSNVGNYYAPTIFDAVDTDMSIARDEIFGPVLATFSFETPEQAVALANDTQYGLSAGIWSRDITKAMRTIRQVRAGRTWINSAGGGAPEMGIGGFKQSGIGREMGHYGFDEYSTFKNVFMGLNPVSTPWVE